MQFQAFGRETNTWTYNGVTPCGCQQQTDKCSKALFYPFVPENCCSTLSASSTWSTEWCPLQNTGFMAICCCSIEMFQCYPNSLNPLTALHKINNADAQKAKQRLVSCCGSFTVWNAGWWLRTVHILPIPVVFLANKWDWSMKLK